MKTDIGTGYRFAKWITENELYNPAYFVEDYEQYLSYTNNSEGFWEDFDYAMEYDFKTPIQL